LKLTGLGGGGAGTVYSCSWMERTGVRGRCILEASVALMLARRSWVVRWLRLLRGGEMGTGATIWVDGMLKAANSVNLGTYIVSF